MRPRVFPAEDDRVDGAGGVELRVASMRPRVFPAEDLQDKVTQGLELGCFNEAAGIPRGRQIAESAQQRKYALQ